MRIKIKPRPPSSRPWLEVVVSVQSRFDEQRWRMGVLANLHGWREFSIAWASCAFLREYGMPHSAPPDLTQDDDLLAWAWDIVNAKVHDALQVCAERSSLDEISIATIFGIMQGSGLIYPTGEVSRRVLDRIARELAMVEASEGAAIATSQLVIMQKQLDIQRLQKPKK